MRNDTPQRAGDLGATTRWFDVAVAEARVALRSLVARPSFGLGSALSLALGMALATAVFAMIDAVFLRPLPYPDQDRLVHFYEVDPRLAAKYPQMSARHFTVVRTEARSFEGVAASSLRRHELILGTTGDATTYLGSEVTANFFAVLGVHPALGRVFDDRDVRSGGAKTVMIGYSLWEARFGRDPTIVGRQLPVDGVFREVVGVMPRDFDYPTGTRVWLPLDDEQLAAKAASNSPQDGVPTYQGIGKLARGVTRQAATLEVAQLYQRSDNAASEQSSPITPRLVPLATHVTAQYRDALELWVAAAIIITLLCATNFATMLLARGMRRRGEIAIRSAMGATPRRIATLLASEGTWIALAGGGLAVVLAMWLLKFSATLLGGDVQQIQPGFGWRTVLFGISATTIVGFLCSIAPAIDLSKADLRTLIAGDGGGTTSNVRELRGRRGLVAIQLALALTAVAVVAALIQADERRARDFGPGYDYSSMVTANLFVPDSALRPGIESQLLSFVASVPSVVSASLVRSPNGQATFLTTDVDLSHRAALDWHDVSPTFFSTVGLRPIFGRLPTAAEVAAKAPVMVISALIAHEAWFHGVNPVGHRIQMRMGKEPPIWYTVIGMVPDVRFGPRFDPLSPAVYTTRSLPVDATETKILLRVRGDPRAGLPQLRSALAAFDARVTINDLRTVDGEVELWRAPSRGRTMFLALVGALALALAVVGVYGLTSYTTELRAREFGIRLAIGASRSHLIRAVIGEVWWLGCVGVGVGVIASRTATRALDSVMGDPRVATQTIFVPLIPTTLAAVALVAIMFAGTAIPLRRVLRMDIMRTVQR